MCCDCVFPAIAIHDLGGKWWYMSLFPAIEQTSLRILLVTHQVTLLKLEIGEL